MHRRKVIKNSKKNEKSKKFYIIFKNFQFQSNLILCIIMT
jgi:hypothetical protein